MATELNFLTPNGVVVTDTANVVGNTTSSDYFSNTTRANTTPSLLVDFGKSGGRLDPRITFRRASVATYTDKLDFIRTANINEPRFEWANGVCQGLLIEEPRTNIFCPLSTSPAHYINSITASPTSIGPDGNAAYRITVPQGSYVFGQISVAPSSSGTFDIANGSTIDFTFTGYFGPSFGNTLLLPDIVIQFSIDGASSFIFNEVVFNAATGAVVGGGSNALITYVVNPIITTHQFGMKKITYTVRYTQDSTARNKIDCYFQIRDTPSNGQYITDGLCGFDYACCQGEIGSTASSYIPTSTAPVTRSRDLAVMLTQYFFNWYNRAAGSMYVEFKQYQNTFSRGILCATTGEINGNNVVYHFFNSSTNLNGEVIINYPNVSPQILNQSLIAYTPGNWTKAVQTVTTLSATTANNTLCVNGTIAPGNTFSTVYGLPEVNSLVIGASRFSDGLTTALGTMNGIIKKIAFYRTPLSNTQMQTITL